MSNKHKHSSHTNNANNGAKTTNGNGHYADAAKDSLPMVASLVGAGIALGVGLYASRRSWMPMMESLNEQLHEQWTNFASKSDSVGTMHSASNTENLYSEAGAGGDNFAA